MQGIRHLDSLQHGHFDENGNSLMKSSGIEAKRS
jgi:hypothetical protein